MEAYRFLMAFTEKNFFHEIKLYYDEKEDDEGGTW